MVENNNAFTPNANPAPTPAAGPAPSAGSAPVSAVASPTAAPVASAASAPSANSATTPVATPSPLPRLGQKFRPAAPRADYTSPATGDIVLDHSAQKSKKPLIIALVAIVLIATIVGILIVVAQHGSSSAKARTNFNTFANYLLYNKDSEDDITTDYQYGTDYYLGSIGTVDERIQFLDNAIERYNAFSISAPSDLRTKVDSYAANLALFALVEQYPSISASLLLTSFIEDPQQLPDSIENYYQPFLESSYQLVNDYGVEYRDMALELIRAYQIFQENGCINTASYVIDYSCRNAVSSANEIYIAYVTNNAFGTDQSSNLRAQVFSGIWELREALYAL